MLLSFLLPLAAYCDSRELPTHSKNTFNLDRSSAYSFFAATCSETNWSAMFKLLKKMKQNHSPIVTSSEVKLVDSSRRFNFQDVRFNSKTKRWAIHGISDLKPAQDLCVLYLALMKANSANASKKTKFSKLEFFLPNAWAESQIRLDGRISDYFVATLFAAGTATCIVSTGAVGSVMCASFGLAVIAGSLSVAQNKSKIYRFLEENFEVICSKDQTIFLGQKSKIIMRKSPEFSIDLFENKSPIPDLPSKAIEKEMPIAFESFQKVADKCKNSTDADQLMVKMRKQKILVQRRFAEIDDLFTQNSQSFEQLSQSTAR